MAMFLLRPLGPPLAFLSVLAACDGRRADETVAPRETRAPDAPRDAVPRSEGAAPPVEKPCEALFAAVLAKKSACSGVQPSASRRADLHAWFVDQCEWARSAPGSVIDDAAIAACGGSLAEAACDGAFLFTSASVPSPLFVRSHEPSLACRWPVGSLANDAPCGADHQCASGWCTAAGGTCGTCKEPLALGSPCIGSGLDCARGSRCHYPENACVRVTDDPGGPCTSHSDCGYGLRCDPGAKTCKPYAPGGEPALGSCSPAAPCEPGLACRFGPAGGTCSAPTWEPNGAPCDPDGSTRCADGTCTMMGESGAGLCVADAVTGYAAKNGAPAPCMASFSEERPDR